MSKIADGGTAYPVITWQSPQGFAIGSMEHGLTKREAFAMAAMQGLCSGNPSAHLGMSQINANHAAEASIMMADALLAALRGDA